MISKRNNWVFTRSALAGTLAVAAFNANALTINAIFDPNVGSQEQADFNSAVQQYESLFSNNATINIKVVNGTATSTNQPVSLGASIPNTSPQFDTSSFNTYVGSVINSNYGSTLFSPNYINSLNGQQLFQLTSAHAKALGSIYNASNLPTLDGTIYFNYSSITANQIGFTGVALHEISEVLGKTSYLPTYISPLDLLRYTSPGVHSFSATASGVYLSLDGGNTHLQDLYSGSSSNGDRWDFNGSNPADPFNAIAQHGQLNTLTSVDIQTMQALGYKLNAVPLPASVWMFLSACLGLGWVNKKRLSLCSAMYSRTLEIKA